MANSSGHTLVPPDIWGMNNEYVEAEIFSVLLGLLIVSILLGFCCHHKLKWTWLPEASLTMIVGIVAGGALPLAMHGKTTEGYIHIADWYATFCEIGGCDGASDASAAAADLPAIDSLSMWPLISGQNSTSPRVEIAAVVDASLGKGRRNSSVLIVGDWKLLTGVQLLSYWQGPEFPNASNYGKIADPKNMQLCTPACLYNIRSDPTEQKNVALENLEKVKEMLARLDELKETHFQLPADDSKDEQCYNQIVANGNFFGPFLP